MSRPAVSTRAVLVAGFAVALLLAGVLSFYASSRPDGLNRVAQDQGFSQTEREHGSADGTFAGYGVEGVDDQRLSGGLAGLAGCGVVLALVGGLTFVVRRRRRGEADHEHGPQPAGTV